MYTQIKIRMTIHWGVEVTKECNRLNIDKSKFVKALIRDYFIRTHGVDLDLQTKEKLTRIPNNTGNGFE